MECRIKSYIAINFIIGTGNFNVGSCHIADSHVPATHPGRLTSFLGHWQLYL
jgi:hypothetical protein